MYCMDKWMNIQSTMTIHYSSYIYCKCSIVNIIINFIISYINRVILTRSSKVQFSVIVDVLFIVT